MCRGETEPPGRSQGRGIGGRGIAGASLTISAAPCSAPRATAERGIGRAAAFTSDTKPRWAEDWIRWPDFAKFWAQIIRSVAGQEVARDISVELTHRLDGDRVLLTADVRDAAGGFVNDLAIELTARHPREGTVKLPVERHAPGLFSAAVPLPEYGRPQHFAWSLDDPAGEDLTTSCGFVYAFSPEFRTLGVNDAALEEIRARGLGDFKPVGSAELRLGGRASAEQLSLWPLLLVGSLVVVPLDILCRRPADRPAHSGLSFAWISARRGSRNGGSASRSPMLSSGSSTANPGPSVASSNRIPLGSRK